MLSKLFTVHSQYSIFFSIWVKDLNLLIFQGQLIAMYLYQLAMYSVIYPTVKSGHWLLGKAKVLTN